MLGDASSKGGHQAEDGGLAVVVAKEKSQVLEEFRETMLNDFLLASWKL